MKHSPETQEAAAESAIATAKRTNTTMMYWRLAAAHACGLLQLTALRAALAAVRGSK